MSQESVKAPRMLTIRETARLGILPEAAIRAGVKRGWVPGIYTGNKFLVNVDRLLDFMNGVDRTGASKNVPKYRTRLDLLRCMPPDDLAKYLACEVCGNPDYWLTWLQQEVTEK